MEAIFELIFEIVFEALIELGLAVAFDTNKNLVLRIVLILGLVILYGGLFVLFFGIALKTMKRNLAGGLLWLGMDLVFLGIVIGVVVKKYREHRK